MYQRELNLTRAQNSPNNYLIDSVEKPKKMFALCTIKNVSDSEKKTLTITPSSAE